MSKVDYRSFCALDPFFSVVMEGLSKYTDGEHYFDTLADDVDYGPLPCEAEAEVAFQQVPHVDDELLLNRLVDAVIAIDPVDRRLREGTVRVEIERASRSRVCQREGDQRHEKHRGNDQ